MTLLETQPIVVVGAPPEIVQAPPAPPAPTPASSTQRGRRRLPLLLGIGATVLTIAGVLIAALPWSATPAARRADAVAPATVRVLAVTPTSVSFRWSDPMTASPVLAYEILRNGAVADVVMPMQMSYDATGLATGRTYRFQVVAVFGNSLSAPTAPIVVTTR
jgi:hypothetical protein